MEYEYSIQRYNNIEFYDKNGKNLLSTDSRCWTCALSTNVFEKKKENYVLHSMTEVRLFVSSTMKCAHPIEINGDYIDFSDTRHGPSYLFPKCTHFASNTSGGIKMHSLTGIRRAMCIQIVRRYETKTVFRLHFASWNNTLILEI